MYLFHVTNYKYIFHILDDLELKSNKLTGNINQGEGIYKTNNYVYLGISDKKFHGKIIGNIIIILDISVIKNRNIYITDHHSSEPKYTTKIIKNDLERMNKLKYLYKNSVEKLNGRAFNVFQQVAVEKNLKLKNKIIGLMIDTTVIDEKKINKIKKYIKKINLNIDIKLFKMNFKIKK